MSQVPATRVAVVPYSADWPDLFGRLRDELLEVFADTHVMVEHIGSTSVPGLAAKPVIDLLLGVQCLVDIEAKFASLSARGYAYNPMHERELPMRRYFARSAPMRVHLHGVEIHSGFWREHLAFRDALRANALLRAEYEALKLRLAAQHTHDKQAYTAAKGGFIQAVLAGLGDASG